MSLLHATVLSTFPEMFPGPLGLSLAGKGLQDNVWSFDVINIRDFGLTKHKTIDDSPYGGGSGFIVRSDVLGNAIDYAINISNAEYIYYMSPRGKLLNQKLIKEIVLQKNIIIICARFEGIDERVMEHYNIQEVSIGDFILSGGEIAALALLDSCIRYLPNITNKEALEEESFSEKLSGLLEYPLYTRPAEWRSMKVPEVLLSGNHSKIRKWRMNKSLEITRLRRPELIKD